MPENKRVIAGRYEVGNLIGRGGMADVYEGVDTRLGRVVAIKVLKSDLANDPNFEARFRQEAQASARMAHPTIVRVYDAGEENDTDTNGNPVRRPYIVMEYVRGTLLRDLLHQRRLTTQEAIDYAQGVLTALEFSHRAGVIHRDIKAANIMITEAGQVKVMDFGIARAVSDGSATLAHTGGIVGTAQYFSPEQARGETVDSRTDLYSTGVLLYEMLAGRPPFKGETAVSVAYQHVSEAVTPPSVHNPALTPELDAVVMRALAKDRGERFQTAEEFREHLLASAYGTPDAPVVAPAAETENPSQRVNPTAELEPIAVDQSIIAGEQAAQAQALDPLDEFEALLRDASAEATTAIPVATEIPGLPADVAAPVAPVGAPVVPPIVAPVAPVTEPSTDWPFGNTTEQPTVSKREARMAAKEAERQAREANEGRVDGSLGASDLDAAASNPFAALGVSFETEKLNQAEADSFDLGGASTSSNSGGGRSGGPTRPAFSKRTTSWLWGAGSGLTVILVGLIVWIIATGGLHLNFNIKPTSTAISVADVTNQTFDAGQITLQDQHLLIQKIYETSDTVPAETITRTDPPAGTQVGENTLITVYVSSGKATVKIPNLVGMTEAQATAALQAAKLTLGSITPSNSASVPKGSVISSDPVVNTVVPEGSVVNLVSSNGMVTVPNVVNLNISDAKNQLSAVDVGLTVSVTTQSACTGTQGTIVLSQSIAPGLAPQKSAIVLYVECLTQ